MPNILNEYYSKVRICGRREILGNMDTGYSALIWLEEVMKTINVERRSWSATRLRVKSETINWPFQLQFDYTSSPVALLSELVKPINIHISSIDHIVIEWFDDNFMEIYMRRPLLAGKQIDFKFQVYAK